MKQIWTVAVCAACCIAFRSMADLFPAIPKVISVDEVESFIIDADLSGDQESAILRRVEDYWAVHSKEAQEVLDRAEKQRAAAAALYSKPNRTTLIADQMRLADRSSLEYRSVATLIEQSLFSDLEQLLTADQALLLHRWRDARSRRMFRPSPAELPLATVDPFATLDAVLRDTSQLRPRAVPHYYVHAQTRALHDDLVELERSYMAILQASSRSRTSSNRMRFRVMDIATEARLAAESGRHGVAAELHADAEDLSKRFAAAVWPTSRSLQDIAQRTLQELEAKLPGDISRILGDRARTMAYGVFFKNPNSCSEWLAHVSGLDELSDSQRTELSVLSRDYRDRQQEFSNLLCQLHTEFALNAMRDSQDWISTREEISARIYDGLKERIKHDTETRSRASQILGAELAASEIPATVDSPELTRAMRVHMSRDQRAMEAQRAREARIKEMDERRRSQRDDPRRRRDNDG